MNYSDFRKTVIKSGEKHHFKVFNSNGTKEAWRWIKKNKWLDIGQPITEREFGIIIKTINFTLQDLLIKGKDVRLPHKMGRLEIRKFKTSLKIKDGKIVTNRPIDWPSTVQLWYEDADSYKKKTLVRYELDEMFILYYNRTTANYKNKTFYQFMPTKVFKRRLKQEILKGGFDALLLGKKI